MLARRALRCVAVAVLLLAGTSAATAQSNPVTIRFIAAPSDDLLPFWYAQSTGAFKQAGLNVIAEKASSGAVVAQAIAGGAEDVGRASLSSLIAAHIRGIPFVLFAPSAIHRKGTSVNSAVIVAKNATFKSVLDLQGKTVSCTAIGDIGYLGLRAMIDAQGGDSSTIKWVELPISAVAAAIDAGRIDAGISTEPFMSRDFSAGKVRALADMLEGYPGEILEGAYFSMRDYAVANSDAIARFQRVLRAAAVYVNAHSAEMVPLLIANTGMDPDVAARMQRAVNGVSFEPTQIQPVIDVAAKYKIIPQRFDARDLFWSGK